MAFFMTLNEAFYYNLSDSVKQILQYSEELAEQRNHSSITVEHLVYGCCKYAFSIYNAQQRKFFSWYWEPSEYIKSSFGLNNSNTPKSHSSTKKISVSRDVELVSRIIKDINAFSVALDLDLLFFIIFYMNNKSYFVDNTLVPYMDVNEQILKCGNINECVIAYAESLGKKTYSKNNKNCKAVIVNEYSSPMQLEHTTDLTYAQYKLSESLFCGRETEIMRVVQILIKKAKNNPVLIGKPGTGKTALIEALAYLISHNKIPRLKNYHILQMSPISLISNSKYRGELEEKVKSFCEQLLALVKKGKKVILYIDEIHSIVNSGITEDAPGLSDLFKPFLLDEKLKVIGTSSFDDYRIIEKDKALKRRFDTVIINEPNDKDTLKILNTIKSSYESFYKVKIADDTLEKVVYLANRYLTDEFFPDKAINLLDDTCSIIVTTNVGQNTTIISEDVYLAVSLKTGIPIEKMTSTRNLDNLESFLNSKVIGQKHVTPLLANSVKRSRIRLNDESRPLASFMFVGPTGVGKTEMAKALAESVFGGSEKIIRLDMSEYMEEHSISKMIGSPPGYVGHEEPGFLTEQVRRNPYSLVLFDEFEKAHPKVYNILLQILDEGHLTDSKGENVNFKNTIIILTSNVGANELVKKHVGFNTNTKQDTINILPELKKKFSPEFLNRIDELVQFNNLTEKDILLITHLHTNKLIEKLKELDISLSISNEVINYLANIGYNPEYGAREIKRTVVRKLTNPISDFILQSSDKVCSISITLDENSEIKIN